jgi:hypothetical protein
MAEAEGPLPAHAWPTSTNGEFASVAQSAFRAKKCPPPNAEVLRVRNLYGSAMGASKHQLQTFGLELGCRTGELAVGTDNQLTTRRNDVWIRAVV